METLQLNVKEREALGKSGVKKIRKGGFVPAILYGGKSSIPLMINSKELIKALETAAGKNAILNLKFGEREYTAVVKDLQKHPLRREIVHADLMEVSMDREIKIKVKLKLLGEPVGVKQKGGILSQQMWEIRLSCLPANIPNEITVDVSNLDVGDAVHIRDILTGEGIKMLEAPDATVASVKMPKAEEVKAEVAVAEAVPAEGAEAAAPAEEKAETKEEKKGK
ncbi:MAG: 50S ribosomal protein L25 [Nitrospinae bacterium]|nr:50S ribosomal protein L25 [Nitrospinota bacterium]